MGKVKKSALAFAALKAGQQVLNDLDGVIMNNTVPDVARYTTEQYVCRLGSPIIAAYGLDKGISYLEELILPKFMRGVLPIAITTLGTATLIHYFGNYFNIEPTANLVETTKQLLNNYQESVAKLTTLNPETHADYLTGAALTLKSGIRLCKNIAESIAHYSEKRKVQRNYIEQQEIQEIEQLNNKKQE